MVVRRYEDFDAFQLAESFRSEVFRIVKASPDAMRDHRFKNQILGAVSGPAKHIAEGFLRRSPRAFAVFLDYALGSIAETELRLADGVQLGYYDDAVCRPAFRLARRCFTATARLRLSQLRYAEKLEAERRGKRKPKSPKSEPRSNPSPEL